MKSIEKLRESSRLDDDKWTLETGEVVRMYGTEPSDPNAVNWGERWREIADEIEAEIERDYMRLPVDADGAPIHVGDNLHSDETGRDFPCRGYNLTLQGSKKWWTVECCHDSYSGTSEYVSAKSCHHVNPRTLEDVLRDVMQFGHDDNTVGERADAAVDKYADEIRELLGSGE